MFYVYVLKSSKNGDVYVGYSEDLKKRLTLHNNKRVKSTKGYAPWKLIYYEAYKSKSDATWREKELKLHAAKEKLFEQIKNSVGAVAKWQGGCLSRKARSGSARQNSYSGVRISSAPLEL